MKELILTGIILAAAGCGPAGSGTDAGPGNTNDAGGSSCGSGSMFTPQCSCNYSIPAPGQGQCQDYSATEVMTGLGVDGGIVACLPDGGVAGCGATASSGVCPTASLVGTCWFTSGTATRFYSPTYTTGSAETFCDGMIQAGGGCFQSN